MLHEFLETHRKELIERCHAKVAQRPAPKLAAGEMEFGVPLFLTQLTAMLRLEHESQVANCKGGCDHSRGAIHEAETEIATAASRHGHELLERGFTVDQVVHGYGDLCQAVTDLAVETRAPISADEFRTLNCCLDNAIADSVTEFGWRRDQLITEEGNRMANERIGFLAHEMRNFLNTAVLSFDAMKTGTVALKGPTSAVLDRSLAGLRDLIDRSLTEVRDTAGAKSSPDCVAVDRFIADVQVSASLEARARGCEFSVTPVEPGLAMLASQKLIHSALSNLLQNAFKFTRAHSRVSLKAYGLGDRVLVEVEDQCGGLPKGKAGEMFLPFEQHGTDRSGVGLGLSIARRGVESCGGDLRVRDMPGLGCVFTIDLPRAGERLD